MRPRLRLVVVACLCAVASAQARIVEEQLDVPVEVTDAYGKTIAQPIRLTVVRDDAATEPRPLAVLQHGRPADGPERAAFGRARFAEASRWFVRQGFIVAMPTRIGYGVSGGEDVEETGLCANKRYPPAFAAAARQTLATLAVMRQRADVLADRTVVVGQSFGGATAVAVAAQNPPGVAVAINFAGGGGGDPKQRPMQPCSTAQLERTFAEYGGSARLPMLWVYAENDRFFGATYPKEWFEAFRKAGGNAEFVLVPPNGDDGHALFTRSPAHWERPLADFLRKHGYAMRDAEAAR